MSPAYMTHVVPSVVFTSAQSGKGVGVIVGVGPTVAVAVAVGVIVGGNALSIRLSTSCASRVAR